MYAVKLQEEAMQPRERLLTYGAESLSNLELLAIMLRTGSRREPVAVLAQQILSSLSSLADFKNLSLQELQSFHGIGRVKACEIKAMIELVGRIQEADRLKLGRVVSSYGLAKKMMAELGDKKQEHLVALYLDTQNKIIHQETIFIGSVRRSVTEPREILYQACKTMATSLIVVHNHPSGVCEPSQNDIDFTLKIKRSCDDLGIVLLDHIIVGKKHYYSFREETDLI